MFNFCVGLVAGLVSPFLLWSIPWRRICCKYLGCHWSKVPIWTDGQVSRVKCWNCEAVFDRKYKRYDERRAAVHKEFVENRARIDRFFAEVRRGIQNLEDEIDSQ